LTIHVFACEISLKRDCNFRGSGNGLGPNLDLVLTLTLPVTVERSSKPWLSTGTKTLVPRDRSCDKGHHCGEPPRYALSVMRANHLSYTTVNGDY